MMRVPSRLAVAVIVSSIAAGLLLAQSPPPALVTHDDIHAIWINPNNSDHLMLGNDGGIAVSWDKSKTWQFIPNLPVGLFYHVNYDMAYPYNVCGGMQDNYNWCGPSASRMRLGIMNYDWFQKPAWQVEIKRMLTSGLKYELDALANKDFQYLTKKYLPRKLKEKDWLD